MLQMRRHNSILCLLIFVTIGIAVDSNKDKFETLSARRVTTNVAHNICDEFKIKNQN